MEIPQKMQREIKYQSNKVTMIKNDSTNTLARVFCLPKYDLQKCMGLLRKNEFYFA